MAHKVVPIILGGTHDLSLGQYYGYESKKDLISVLNIDPRLDVEIQGDYNETFLSKLITHQPNFLFSYNHLGHQEYLVEADALSALEKLYFEALRLGEIRDNIKQAEPVIRMANMLAFDTSAIKENQMLRNAKAEPFRPNRRRSLPAHVVCRHE